MFHGSDHERRASAGGNAADNVALADPGFIQSKRTVRFQILGAFLCLEYGWYSSSDETLNHVRIGAEGRRTFGRVEDTEASTRTRTGIKEASAPAKRVHDDIHRLTNPLQLRPHGLSHKSVFLVHDFEDGRNRCRIDLHRARITLLGGQLLKLVKQGRALGHEKKEFGK
jgi:hypothetical protein